MKDSTKRILIIGGSALVIGGVLYYFLVYRKTQTQGVGDQTGGTEPVTTQEEEKPKEPNANVKPDKELTDAKNLLITNFKGDKEALKKRLAKEKRDFILTWANAVKQYKVGKLPKNAFIYDTKVYDISWGIKRFDKSPVGKTAKTITEAVIRLTPDSKSEGKSITGVVGKVESYKWNIEQNLMFLYVPKNNWSSKYKWVFAGKVTI